MVWDEIGTRRAAGGTCRVHRACCLHTARTITIRSKYMTTKTKMGNASRKEMCTTRWGRLARGHSLPKAALVVCRAAARGPNNLKQEVRPELCKRIPVNPCGSKSARAQLEPHGPTGSLTSRRTIYKGTPRNACRLGGTRRGGPVPQRRPIK